MPQLRLKVSEGRRKSFGRTPGSQLFEGQAYGWGQQLRQFRDVVEAIDVERGLLNGALAVCGDHGAGEASVLDDDVGVGEYSVAGGQLFCRGCCRP
jgi:hypothetical protein